jgi:SAM-dependent methyltransferase
MGSPNLGYLLRELLHLPRTCEPHCQILEVGCGGGELSAELARCGYTVIGIDASAESIGISQLRYKDIINLSFLVVDFNDVRQLEGLGNFSYIVSAFSLHHAFDIRKSILSLRSMLADGGKLEILDLFSEAHGSLIKYWISQNVVSLFCNFGAALRSTEKVGVSDMLRFLSSIMRFGCSSAGRAHIRQDLSEGRPPSLSVWKEVLAPLGASLCLLCGSVFAAQIPAFGLSKGLSGAD